MKKWMGLLPVLLAVSMGPGVQAAVIVSPWAPVFKGIDLADGQQDSPVLHRVLCYRVDLADPDIRLFTTPKCTNCGVYETLAENTSHFLDQYQLQAAINGGFYSSSTGPNDVPLGTTEDVKGLAISEGVLVSPADDATRAAALLFTTNNTPIFIPRNSPGTNTDGIFTAISGDRPLLTNGVVAVAPNPTDRDPRTALGISEDRRYLYLMTLDGRQPGWSSGADWYDTALWLQRFGAHDAINVDGGGSTTMVMQDCTGGAQRLNRSSFVYTYGRERIVGHNFGVRALPLAASGNRATVAPGSTTAVITWQTDFAGTTQVEYGPTAAYGSATPLDPRPARNHVATLTGLQQGSNYFYRVVSQGDNGESFSEACRFLTRRAFETTEVFGLTQAWKYTTNNLDAVNWKAASYNDSGWMGPGPGLLHALETSTGVAPKNTEMPPAAAPIPRTYYFRTRFNFSGPTAGVALTFSNYVDDGAVFYLNGVEVRRLRMPAAPTVINNATYASGVPCMGSPQSGDALTTCPDVFTISGSPLASLVQGENVMAVEVHNYTTGSDLVFGTALLKHVPVVEAPTLNLWTEGDVVTLFWNGEGFVLQESADLGIPANWSDVPGPVTTSPFSVTNSTSTYYRLRK